MTVPRWWLSQSATVNGIFKGGGAKGLLYAGALRGLEEKGYWFRAVAGSSAGAITATLVAAGLTAQQTTDAVPRALSCLRRNWLGDLLGRPIVGTDKLRDWLESELVNQVMAFSGPRTSNGPVTFEELYSATGIELYVVCVDVAERQPIVFNFKSTPTLAVAGAVMASSSIPLAFRPGRLKVTYDDGSTEVHRLMDGGVWANYPSFVFKDTSFRLHHGLQLVPPDSITIGFAVEGGPGRPIAAPQSLLNDWTSTGGDRGAPLKGWLRLAPLRIYLLTVVPIVLALQAAWTTYRYGLLFLKDTVRGSSAPALIQRIAGFFDGFFTHFWPATVSVIVLMVGLALVLIVIGATLLDSGVPAMRTLMAVGTDVPYWVGTTPDDHIVRLHAQEGLGTLSFNLKPPMVTKLVNDAFLEAQPQLATILKDPT